MSIISVGPTGQFATIHQAVAASASGDTIEVQAGVYTNDFTTIRHSLTLTAVGGWVQLITDNAQPPDGKAYITEGAAGISVTISGFAISGVTVPDGNGAAIRYEGGNLTLDNDYIFNNQEGILGAADLSGSITITNSEFARNGLGGDGHTHGIYVGPVSEFTLTNSYIHDTNIGHEVKSRAQNNVITNNRIFDNDASASYSVDLPNGGTATITGNVIQQGPNSQNPAILAYGEEGIPAGYQTGATVAGNTIVNDQGSGYLLLNPGGYPVSLSGNTVFGLTQIPSGNTALATRPVLDLASIQFLGSSAQPPPPTTDPPPPPPPPPDPLPDPSPTPVLTPLEQYHADVLADFQAWAPLHVKLATMDRTLKILNTELTSTTVLGIIKGDRWSN
jgi:hypothetical protein